MKEWRKWGSCVKGLREGRNSGKGLKEGKDIKEGYNETREIVESGKRDGGREKGGDIMRPVLGVRRVLVSSEVIACWSGYLGYDK